MANHSIDNVYTKSFTPKEYQVELLDAAKERNIIVCVGNGPNKTFIALKLIQELSNVVRKSPREGGQRTVYLTATDTIVQQLAVTVQNLTDLNVGQYVDSSKELDLNKYQVLVMTCDVCWDYIEVGQLRFRDINLLVVDECHYAIRDHTMKKVMEACWQVPLFTGLRVIGLTSPLMPGPGGVEPGRLEAEIKRLEGVLHCTAETASDIVSVLRYCSKPKEMVVQCGDFEFSDLHTELEEQVAETYAFLEDHRYDPSEIYDDEFSDDIRDIPDPKVDPFSILKDFKEVLATMGPFCADKAALLLLIQIEKLKVKTPYERHFLLLCLVSSVMLKIRAICDRAFEAYSEKERIYKFSSPKILRLIEVIRQYKPKRTAAENDNTTKENDNAENSGNTENNNEEEEENNNNNNSVENVNNSVEDVSKDCKSRYNNSGNTGDNSDRLESKTNDTVNLGDEPGNNFNEIFENIARSRNGLNEVVVRNGERDESLSDKGVDETIHESNNSGCENCKENCVGFSLIKENGSSCILDNNIVNKDGNIPGDNLNSTHTNRTADCDSDESDDDDDGDDRIRRKALKGNDNNHSLTIKYLSDNNLGSNNMDDVINKESNSTDDVIMLTDNCKDTIDPAVSETNVSNGLTNGVNHIDTIPDMKVTEVVLDDGSSLKGPDSLVNEDAPLKGNGVVSENERQNGGVVDDPALNWEISTGGRGGRWRGRGRGWRFRGRGNQQQPYTPRFNKFTSPEDAENLCAIILVEKRFTAKIISHLLNDLRRGDPDFSYVCAQFTVAKIADPVAEPREAELEHRKQEEVLKRFRMRECNVLVGTSLLEEGIDLPKCNLVVRYDIANNYRSYAQSKGRARAPDSHYVHLIEKQSCDSFVTDLAQSMEIEKMLLRRCANQEPSDEEEKEADLYNDSVKPFKPVDDQSTSVSLSSAVALVNRYCAKLPSDTFTRLTPISWVDRILFNGQEMYVCSIRLPINSPVKQDIVGHPMPSRVLARRIAALETCRILHSTKELDDNLQPVGKESFQTLESPGELPDPEEPPPQLWDTEPRPGTTKRRQYYYKRIASSLNDCRPEEGVPAMLYHLEMILTCPLPEEQNTRGRKLHPPEDSPQGFGILTLKTIPKICPFPIFTRSGEVRVSLDLSSTDILLSKEQLEKISIFLNFTFTSVLRLQKYLMMFDPNANENSYLIVPTRKSKEGIVEVDWAFLDVIFKRREEVPHYIPDEEREDFAFDPVRYVDAVVMPWYRNQDQPQYFYVAEICNHLNPKSAFPGSDYETFEEYYSKKYGIQIQNTQQPLLDVDHTSARLNFLTPRYVNRKGVALPTSSEETKRAKRENLEQKQILVPELCMVHPFPASLWRKAVCLPCMLYRINALLLADEIRMTVAREIYLGMVTLKSDFEWQPLDFGWSLADVLRKSKEENERLALAKLAKNGGPKITEIIEEDDLKREEGDTDKKGEGGEKMSERKDGGAEKTEENPTGDDKERVDKKDGTVAVGEGGGGGGDGKIKKKKKKKKEDDVDDDEDGDVSDDGEEEEDGPWMEIGTWSNEMAEMDSNFTSDPSLNNFTTVRYGSPSWEIEAGAGGMMDYYDSDVDSDESDDDADDSSSDMSDAGRGGLRITFKNDYLAEAVDDDADLIMSAEEEADWEWQAEETTVDLEVEVEMENKRFKEAVERNEVLIKENGMLLDCDTGFVITRNEAPQPEVSADDVDTNKKDLGFELQGYAMPENVYREVSDSGISTDRSLDGTSSSSEYVDFLSDEESLEDERSSGFSFDSQPLLEDHPGPSPSLLLQALTMSNANDGINLERLETIGDSFLKFAITTYLYCTYDAVHEGKLSHLRSKQVSNLNLYRLGKRKIFGESMIATKFEPHDNWLPPCYFVPKELERALIEAGVPACQWNQAELPALREMTTEEINAIVKERGEQLQGSVLGNPLSLENLPCFVPYNLITQHSIPDKSIADCVEALIGAYLIACGPRGALIFMSWLGIRVLPREEIKAGDETNLDRPVGSLEINEDCTQVRYGFLKPPRSPLLRQVGNPEGELEKLLDGFEVFERNLRYRFRDRSYLLQAMTHASYATNRLTDCYQRLEFLGDAVLDYLITRHLYEDKRQHCPGALTDLRSALVNNTIFASLAVRHGFHKFFRHLSPGLSEVVERFVRIQEENSHAISEECYLIGEEECEEAEDVEVPKALGDVFESVAGAIFLDSGMSLDAVWMVYYHMMKNEIEQFSTNVPKSPIRELLELEPETAKFGKPEKLADGRRVRVTVEVFGKGAFKGIGRNYRIAKCTAAKCALKQLKKRGLLAKKFSAQRW